MTPDHVIILRPSAPTPPARSVLSGVVWALVAVLLVIALAQWNATDASSGPTSPATTQPPPPPVPVIESGV